MHILHAQVSRSVWAKQAAMLESLYNGALSSRWDIKLYEVASPSSSFFPMSAGALQILDLPSKVAGWKDFYRLGVHSRPSGQELAFFAICIIAGRASQDAERDILRWERFPRGSVVALVCCWADGSGWWVGENRSLGPSCIAAGSKFQFFSDSVSLVGMRKSTGGLDEVITNGLASSPHDWLKVENKSKVQPRWLLKCWYFSLH